ncbi:MAG: hypothetical protein J7L25_12130, partial [Deltaproteobacteria bacterium]|nr:hypothetical protein [Candidatus Tharpella aukensis]
MLDTETFGHQNLNYNPKQKEQLNMNEPTVQTCDLEQVTASETEEKNLMIISPLSLGGETTMSSNTTETTIKLPEEVTEEPQAPDQLHLNVVT